MGNDAPSTVRFLESNLRELWAVVQGNERVAQERDKRYEERFTANKEAVAAAFAAAKEASEETKAGLKEYKAGANEWRGTVNDLIATREGTGAGMKWLATTALAVFSVVVAFLSAAIALFIFFASRPGVPH
jgi:hypothetical protein